MTLDELEQLAKEAKEHVGNSECSIFCSREEQALYFGENGCSPETILRLIGDLRALLERMAPQEDAELCDWCDAFLDEDRIFEPDVISHALDCLWFTAQQRWLG